MMLLDVCNLRQAQVLWWMFAGQTFDVDADMRVKASVGRG